MNKLTSITSAANPLIKKLRALATSKKARQQNCAFIIEGRRGIDTLLKHPNNRYTLKQLVITPEWENDPFLPAAIETILLPDQLFAKISDVRNAQGLLGVVQFSDADFKPPAAGHLLLLDNIRDPGNLGTLIRSAVGAGYRGVLLAGDCVEPFNPKVIRSTMGTFAHANIHAVSAAEIETLKHRGFEICVTTGLGGENLYHTHFSNQTVLVIGSEAHGVSDELFALATKKVTIPLAAECESLNAAIAGSICMFQINNQADGGSKPL